MQGLYPFAGFYFPDSSVIMPDREARSHDKEITKKMNQVLAIVVTYNRLAMLKQCISHLKAQTYPCDILIVDNASTDGTEAWMQQNCTADPCPAVSEQADFHQLFYENTGCNLGGAGGFQYGLRRSAERGYVYAWIMDDDAFAEPDCLEKLMQGAFRLGQFGFLASAVFWKDGSLCRMNWQRKYPLPKRRSEHHLLESDLDQELVQIQSSTFVSALFPIQTIRTVGLPIKEFFIWCDDIEYTRRITLKYHLPAYVVTASHITHHINNNEGTSLAKDGADRIPRYHYAFRNENYMYRQYGIRGFGYYLTVIAYNTLMILFHARDHRLQRLGVVYRNLFTGLFFNPQIEYLKD